MRTASRLAACLIAANLGGCAFEERETTVIAPPNDGGAVLNPDAAPAAPVPYADASAAQPDAAPVTQPDAAPAPDAAPVTPRPGDLNGECRTDGTCVPNLECRPFDPQRPNENFRCLLKADAGISLDATVTSAPDAAATTTDAGTAREPVCPAGLRIECPCGGGLVGAQQCADDGSRWSSACTQCAAPVQFPACAAGLQIPCACGGGREGVQACLANGSGYSACMNCSAGTVCPAGLQQDCPCGGGNPNGAQRCADDGSRWGSCGCGQPQLDAGTTVDAAAPDAAAPDAVVAYPDAAVNPDAMVVISDLLDGGYGSRDLCPRRGAGWRCRTDAGGGCEAWCLTRYEGINQNGVVLDAGSAPIEVEGPISLPNSGFTLDPNAVGMSCRTRPQVATYEQFTCMPSTTPMCYNDAQRNTFCAMQNNIDRCRNETFWNPNDQDAFVGRQCQHPMR